MDWLTPRKPDISGARTLPKAPTLSRASAIPTVCHPGVGRDLNGEQESDSEIPAFAGMIE